MHERMGIPFEEALSMPQEYLQRYGTTLFGLQANYNTLDMYDYLEFIHDVPLRNYINPNPGLRSVLDAIPIRKFIFTNADANHAHRVIKLLELDGCFDGILDILEMSPYCKPMQEAFAKAMKLAGETNPHHCVIIDDSPRNICAARQEGMFSILYGTTEPHQEADAVLTDLLFLPTLLKTRADIEMKVVSKQG